MNVPPEKPETSATQRAYQDLRRMIVTGELGPGQKLKIEGLRERLDIGASPIREALSLLTSDHLVERIDQRGFRAAATSLENFTEILSLRCTLEDLALRQSIAAATQSWEENVVLSNHRMARARANKAPDFEQLHKAFHMALLANAPSQILLKFCGQLYDLNIRYRYLAAKTIGHRNRDVGDEHDQIMKAAIEGDADKASRRLLRHYRKTGSYLTPYFGSPDTTDN